MRRNTFVALAVLAFGLVLVSFLVRALSRLVVSTETATLLSLPFVLLAAGLVAVLFVQSVLAATGLRPLEG